jgi:phytoene synthase
MAVAESAAEWDFPNAATPEGSDAYYAVRFAPPRQHDGLARLFAWREQLEGIVARATDPGVARLKLDWWREELERAAGGSARHPLAKALAPGVATQGDLDPWLQMLEAAERRILRRQPADESEFAEQCGLAGGSFGVLLSRLANTAADAQALANAQALGAYAEAVARVRDLASHLQRQWCPLPASRLRAAGLSCARLHEAEAAEALPGCLDDILGEVTPDPALWRAARRTPAENVARLAVQARVLHRALQRRRYPVMRVRVELTPVRRLWAAWRLR